jgi:predicted Zn-dependent protease
MFFRLRKRHIVGWTDRACLTIASLLIFCIPLPTTAQTPESSRPDAPEFDLHEMRIRTLTKTLEMRIGRQATRRFERRFKLVEDVAVQEFVDRIAQNLAVHSEAAVPITIKVVDSKDSNAVSFPGGFLYISSTLILAMNDEAEVASVVAHEIAHVVARDGMRNNRYMGTGGHTDSRIIQFSESTDGASELENLFTPLTFLGSQLEIDADAHAIQYMQDSGYDPNALVGFLEKLRAKELTEQKYVLRMFQTHAATAERIRLAQEQIDANPSTLSSQIDTTTELQKIKTLLMDYAASHPLPN